MDLVRILFSRCAALFGKQRLDADLDEELGAHIDLAIEENLKRGMTPKEARRAALRDFGGVAQTREAYRTQRGIPLLELLLLDLRHSLRRLRKSPGFAATVIATIALGIGATTAIFTVMNAVLLRSLPVPNPQQLVYLHLPNDQPFGATNTGDSGETSFSFPAFQALRQDRAFSDLMAFAPLSNGKVAVRMGNDSPEQASGQMVSGNFFSGLGVATALGQGITAEDEQQHSAVATLSYAYWNRRFSKDPSILGRVMYIKGIPFTIRGVAADGFSGVRPGEFTDFWIPLQRRPELNPWGSSSDLTLYGSPNWWCMMVIARLAPGVTAQQAVAQATPAFQAAAYAALGQPDPGHPKATLASAPAKGIQGLGDNYREPITILMALVTLVLLIACSNVAMLFVARNAARQRDFCLRMALGAQRGTLLRQLLTESTLLVISGSLLGLLFAFGGARAIAAWAQLELNLSPDRNVLLFACAVTVLATIVFGLAPLRTATTAPAVAALRVTPSTSNRGSRSGTFVLAAQIALCFALLTAAGLLVRTLINFERTNLGMRTQGLLVFGITPQKTTGNGAGYAFYSGLLDRMRTLPGVESATFVSNRLGSGWSSNDEPTVDGVTHSYEQIPLRTNNVGPGFLHVLGIPLLQGRDIRDSDTATSPRVVIVNETFVKKIFPNTNPLGHTLANSDSKEHPYTIVGVAKDSKYRGVDEMPRAMAYFPYTQTGNAPSSLQVELRTSGDPLALQHSVERAVREIDPDLPLEKLMTQAAVFENSYSQERLFAQLSVFLGLLAAMLVVLGLFGTLSYRISRRNVEIGVRMALGAQRRQVLTMVLREAFHIAAFGTVVGVPLALLTGHLMGSMLFALQPYDLVTLSLALLAIVGISLTAGYLPARRAASMNPMRALRSE